MRLPGSRSLPAALYVPALPLATPAASAATPDLTELPATGSAWFSGGAPRSGGRRLSIDRRDVRLAPRQERVVRFTAKPPAGAPSGARKPEFRSDSAAG